jgi:putative FmdB family regulatory protein
MPIYEYECPGCSHRFEQLVRIGAEAPPCPQCASQEVRKRISASGFILKGGGWYKDHYGLKSSSGASSESSGASTASEGSTASASSSAAASTGAGGTTGSSSSSSTTSTPAATTTAAAK